ncbi:hypothetical protein B0A50_01253 [Salinomyces thailandicus]|uniref:RRM domain-containing protein n=1 Tax=Salinomyces thailandicus TaxID=706561 RepID=A0A4U0UA48_9PEZI|nr:hypothetical protein B0A50_01253 [Salinomyces thailandica]
MADVVTDMDARANGQRSLSRKKLTKNVNEAHLREIFSSYGEIEDLEMPMNKQFMMNKGIAYILYSDAKYAEEAIACMHEAQLDGACINAGWTAAEERHEEPSATTEELFAIQKSATKEEKKPSLQQQGSEREQVPTAKEEVR